jgi:hypothetical protein
MWRFKGKKDNMGTLYSAENMRAIITGEKTVVRGKKPGKVAASLVEKADTALIRLKSLMGARMYMRTSTVSDIFRNQVEQIRLMLDAIEDALVANPRDVRSKSYAAWVKQDLAVYWLEYMGERFKIAHTRTHNDMDKYLKLVDDTWCAGRPKSKPGSPAGSRPGSRAGSPKPGSRAGSPKLGSRATSPKPGSPAGSRANSPAPGSRPTTPDPIDSIKDLFAAMDLDHDVKIKNLCEFRDKLQAKWNVEKNIPWEAPW